MYINTTKQSYDFESFILIPRRWYISLKGGFEKFQSRHGGLVESSWVFTQT